MVYGGKIAAKLKDAGKNTIKKVIKNCRKEIIDYIKNDLAKQVKRCTSIKARQFLQR